MYIKQLGRILLDAANDPVPSIQRSRFHMKNLPQIPMLFHAFYFVLTKVIQNNFEKRSLDRNFLE